MNSAKKMNFVEKHASQETTLLEKQEKGIEKVTEIERSDETFNCPYCDKVFEDAFGLKRHKRTRGSLDRTDYSAVLTAVKSLQIVHLQIESLQQYTVSQNTNPIAAHIVERVSRKNTK